MLAVAVPGRAAFYDARVAWLPSRGTGVVGYRVYHAAGDELSSVIAETPAATAADGTVAAVVTALDEHVDHRFVVTAVAGDGLESPASNARVVVGGGTCSMPVAREDRDTLHVARFGVRTNGGVPVIVAGASLSARGSRRRATSVRVAVQAGDGTVLYRLAIPATAFHGRGGRRRFSDGLRTVVVGRHGRRTSIHVRAVAPDLTGESGRVSWTVGVGTACARDRRVRVRWR